MVAPSVERLRGEGNTVFSVSWKNWQEASLVYNACRNKAAFTPGQHVARGNMLPGNMLLLAVNKIVASLLPVCCWIQRDTSRLWHKWIVIMSPRYSQQHVALTSNLLRGNMLPSTYMLTAICCSSGQHGNILTWCKRSLRGKQTKN